MTQFKSILLTAVLFATGRAGAVTCFETKVGPGDVVNAPAGKASRLVFMVPQRGDEIGKITLMTDGTPFAESVIMHTPGEPVEYQLEGDKGTFLGTDFGRTLDLSVPTGIFAVNRDRDIIVLHPNARSHVPKYNYTLQIMTGAECKRLYPDQGKVRYE